MKHSTLTTIGLLFCITAHAHYQDAPPTNIGECLEWETVCKTQTHCTQRNFDRSVGCYHCRKTFGNAELYGNTHGQVIDACSPSDVTYLQNNGYTCSQPYGNGKCLYSVDREYCDIECKKRAEPPKSTEEQDNTIEEQPN